MNIINNQYDRFDDKRVSNSATFVFIFFKKSWRKNVCVFYFIISLLNNTIFINSSLLGSIFTMGFNINTHHSSTILCKLFYYISYLVSIYLPLILILSSIHFIWLFFCIYFIWHLFQEWEIIPSKRKKRVHQQRNKII